MLRLFTPVAIVCDRTMLREADALRGVLESFRLHVDFHYFVQKRQILDFFSQQRNYAYTIIFCHGSGETPEDMHLRLEVVDQEDAVDGFDMQRRLIEAGTFIVGKVQHVERELAAGNDDRP